jgi:mono/diheme cytochrome c family protein
MLTTYGKNPADQFQRTGMRIKIFRIAIIAAFFAASAGPTSAAAQPVREPTRGELLYSTYCVACHNTQVHWREKKIATDWSSLRAQVNRWQSAATLKWSNEDITAVARYLNALHYRYPVPD